MTEVLIIVKLNFEQHTFGLAVIRLKFFSHFKSSKAFEIE